MTFPPVELITEYFIGIIKVIFAFFGINIDEEIEKENAAKENA